MHYHDSMLKQKEEERKEKTALPLRREREGVVVAPP